MTVRLDPAPTRMLYELPEVCKLLSLGLTKVKELIYDGALPSVRIGTRRFVRDTDLRAYVDGLQPDHAPSEEAVA